MPTATDVVSTGLLLGLATLLVRWRVARLRPSRKGRLRARVFLRLL